MYATSDSDRMFDIEYQFMLISIGKIFTGAILMKVFYPPFVWITSISSSVQSQTVTTISRLSTLMEVENVYGRIQLMVIVLVAYKFVKPMHICNRPV